MKTIAEQLNVKEFPFIIRNNKGDYIYIEYRDMYWCKYEYDSNGWEIYYESSDGFWIKKEYDSKGVRIYYEDSEGEILDKKVKELTLDQIAEKFGIEVSQLKIKK